MGQILHRSATTTEAIRRAIPNLARLFQTFWQTPLRAPGDRDQLLRLIATSVPHKVCRAGLTARP
jgi:hypothetical protein